MIKLQTITLQKDLGLRSVTAIHGELVEALANNDAVVLQIPDNAEIDLSFLQLIQSARATATLEGKAVLLNAPIQEKHHAILKRAGLEPVKNSEDAKFWLHERF